MFVTIDRAAIESAICTEYPARRREGWYTAECELGIIAVCEYEESAQELVVESVERRTEGMDADEVEYAYSTCAIRSATDAEVIDALIKRELHNVELGAQCTDSIGQFKRQILVELVALGYPEDGFIRFDDAEPCYRYYEGDMGFKVSPLF